MTVKLVKVSTAARLITLLPTFIVAARAGPAKASTAATDPRAREAKSFFIMFLI